ncbi:Holin-like protein CidA [Methylobacterium cerastii]|uniref:Holin-like protein CidA n=1 Tax=Methylobacterium cerastii TaxID=932741 RepID=A0ABQ4QC58_9HYPH|nr:MULTISPECIES: CidA/LrgA family protein [Methylobacterium]TXM91867.1 CidA/LrgA family protein [Methylobacterium sp. WL122]TXM76721.1 CidA/LrgA family protein [Methylobacterium sp. WL12]TXN05341.1 CidA/LrgA family protein [Methylobacterium sp. WL103]TXN85045.1 CidA/LrgA family protein [Methylobacterium sp. WL8]GJD42809.1 Holin-like protein CidA [Methylobacterium cerastii]
MIASLTLILLAQLLGEGLARSAGLPVPGPVLGMALMLAFLVLRDRRSLRLAQILPKPLTDGTLETTARGLLSNLSLMFVPAGAGIVGRLDVVQAQGLRLAVVVVVSTAAALVATVLVFLWVARLTARTGSER